MASKLGFFVSSKMIFRYMITYQNNAKIIS